MASARDRFISNLAAGLAAGDWSPAALRDSAFRATGKRFRWAAALMNRLLKAIPDRPSHTEVVAFLEKDPGFVRVCANFARDGAGFPVHCRFLVPDHPAQRPEWAKAVVDLPNEAALAAWLGVTSGRLRWYADLCDRNRKHGEGPLRTYRYRWIKKRRGRARLLEIPKTGLKQLQRQILHGILDAIPPHPAAHGFRPGRSAMTNAAEHCGRDSVACFDLTDFFPAIPAARVVRIFRTIGYTATVARLLAGLCTTRLPQGVWDRRPEPSLDGTDHAIWQRHGKRHIPQGAPTSPALANLVAYRLDCRLAGLAARLDANYTRYADDLTFSGGKEIARGAKRLRHLVAVIALEEGFALNFRKSRLMRRTDRQMVTGLVVNSRPNVPRHEYDRLKAILTNCVRFGPSSQNRERHPSFRAHLAGRIAHFMAVSIDRRRKLGVIFNQIDWNDPDPGTGTALH